MVDFHILRCFYIDGADERGYTSPSGSDDCHVDAGVPRVVLLLSARPEEGKRQDFGDIVGQEKVFLTNQKNEILQPMRGITSSDIITSFCNYP